MQKTFGEKRVRIDYSNKNEVNTYIKTMFANVIDKLENMRSIYADSSLSVEDKAEQQRLISVGQTQAELACMACVKAVTII